MVLGYFVLLIFSYMEIKLIWRGKLQVTQKEEEENSTGSPVQMQLTICIYSSKSSFKCHYVGVCLCLWIFLDEVIYIHYFLYILLLIVNIFICQYIHFCNVLKMLRSVH